ncbi:MAG: helix-turn-helix domain-containing protein [Anaerolineae bacterium]|jgi:transcriptional regulator with XRE-family HTH domain
MDYKVLFGAAVKIYRKEAGLSQEELAALSKLDRTYISGIERGVRNPTLLTIYRLATALEIGPEAFFTTISNLAEIEEDRH